MPTRIKSDIKLVPYVKSTTDFQIIKTYGAYIECVLVGVSYNDMHKRLYFDMRDSILKLSQEDFLKVKRIIKQLSDQLIGTTTNLQTT